MRVATYSTSEDIVSQIQKLSLRQSRLQNQAATGQRIFQPEDDPTATGRLIGLNSESSQISQFQSNARRAMDVSESTYGGLQAIKSISDRAGELAVLGAGAQSPEAYKAYFNEVNQLIEQSVQLGNTKFGNDYLFAGTAVSAPPFAATRNGAGQVTAVAFAGNAGQTAIQLSSTNGIAAGTTNATNLGLRDFLNNLVALRDGLAAGTNAAVAAVQAPLENSENMLIDGLSEHGSIQLRIEVNQKQLQVRSDQIDKLISKEADADLPTTVVQLSQTATAYEAALSSATKILQLSILDYLR